MKYALFTWLWLFVLVSLTFLICMSMQFLNIHNKTSQATCAAVCDVQMFTACADVWCCVRSIIFL